jgi:hypothetical protein
MPFVHGSRPSAKREKKGQGLVNRSVQLGNQQLIIVPSYRKVARVGAFFRPMQEVMEVQEWGSRSNLILLFQILIFDKGRLSESISFETRVLTKIQGRSHFSV